MLDMNKHNRKEYNIQFNITLIKTKCFNFLFLRIYNEIICYVKKISRKFCQAKKLFFIRSVFMLCSKCTTSCKWRH